MEYIKSHKKQCIIVGCIILLFVLIFLIMKLFMVDGSKSSYGNRLDGMNKVKISNNVISKLENGLEEKEEVESAKYRRQGRLIYVDMIVKEGVSADTAKEIGNTVLEYFSDKEKSYYDIQIIIDEKKVTENSGYPIIGYKHKTSEGIVW